MSDGNTACQQYHWAASFWCDPQAIRDSLFANKASLKTFQTIINPILCLILFSKQKFGTFHSLIYLTRTSIHLWKNNFRTFQIPVCSVLFFTSGFEQNIWNLSNPNLLNLVFVFLVKKKCLEPFISQFAQSDFSYLLQKKLLEPFKS